MRTVALIVAAGRAKRFGGDMPKQFREVCGRPLLSWTLSRFEAASAVDETVLVVAEEFLVFTQEKVVDPFDLHKVAKIVTGGEARQDSVRLGLKALSAATDLVAIHDGARPLVLASDIDQVIHAATAEGAAMLAVPIDDTLKKVRSGRVLSTVNRQSIYCAQTPQVFEYNTIRKLHAEASAGSVFTDDAGLAEQNGVTVAVVEPEGLNIKVTTQRDFQLVEMILKGEEDA
ncbi:MAG: 2-C-methyl-D-erythritol 4-phosphate cytidylyltransferase [Candidatus Zixiibacteriota bacterium]|nr:MAG: 2-C-methyl-D-erythritol 4-phosphate cytidylyltransferase [candidate division Zixibacteria bacterium]